MYCTKLLIENIQQNKPIVFMKLGDGEYYCTKNDTGQNCDLDNFTRKKGNGILEALRDLTENANHVYFGAWWNQNIKSYWESQTTKPIQWVNYHSIIIDKSDMDSKNSILWNKIELYKTIQKSTLKKIYICNKFLIKAERLLNIDCMIHISLTNWFDTDFENVFNKIKENYDEKGTIILFSAGMGAKPLIHECIKAFPNGIYLDIGSALDFICTQRDSRGHFYSYDALKYVFKDLLPEDWDNERYNSLLNEARVNLGKHL